MIYLLLLRARHTHVPSHSQQQHPASLSLPRRSLPGSRCPFHLARSWVEVRLRGALLAARALRLRRPGSCGRAIIARIGIPGAVRTTTSCRRHRSLKRGQPAYLRPLPLQRSPRTRRKLPKRAIRNANGPWETTRDTTRPMGINSYALTAHVQCGTPSYVRELAGERSGSSHTPSPCPHHAQLLGGPRLLGARLAIDRTRP